MDVPAVAAGPWIALGAALGALLLLAAGATVLWLRSPAGPEPTTPDEPRDDLADFLAHPPGTPGAPGDDGDGWVPLAPLPPPTQRGEQPARRPTGVDPVAALAGLAVGALLLVGTAAALAAAQGSPAAAPDEPAAASSTAVPTSGSGDGVVARLTFEGVVLEEHAVGITAAYPELELAVGDGGHAAARLRLPAVNCLAVAAPPEPGDPGCRTARTEYAELAAPGLRVERDGDRLTISGRFATYRRPPGASAEPTGRSYEISIAVAAAGEERAGWRTAEGELRWEDQRAGTRAGAAASVLRAHG